MVAYQNDGGQWLAVSKQSAKKTNLGGKKHAVRVHDENQMAVAEQISSLAPSQKTSSNRELLVPLLLSGQIQEGVTGKVGVEAARLHHNNSKKALPASALRLTKGEPAIPTKFV
jgi:nicotinate phosphoribosyltransferase